MTRPFASTHLLDSRIAIVRTTPEAAERYRTLVAGSLLDSGALIVEELRQTPSAPPDAFLVMEKVEHRWSYLMLDSEGRPTPIHADLCQRCHAEGLSDELFGVGEHGIAPAPGE